MTFSFKTKLGMNSKLRELEASLSRAIERRDHFTEKVSAIEDSIEEAKSLGAVKVPELDRLDKAIIKMRDVLEMSFKDIANLLDLSVSRTSELYKKANRKRDWIRQYEETA